MHRNTVIGVRTYELYYKRLERTAWRTSSLLHHLILNKYGGTKADQVS